MRDFYVRPLARLDALAGVEWYENLRPGLGDDFADDVERAFEIIRTTEELVTVPYAVFPAYVVRRTFLSRFPYRVFLIETSTARDVIGVLRHGRAESRWRARL